MGTTAEAVAKFYKINREDQDEFAFNSDKKQLMQLAMDYLKEIVPITVTESYLDETKKSKEIILLTQMEGQEKIQQLKNYQN